MDTELYKNRQVKKINNKAVNQNIVLLEKEKNGISRWGSQNMVEMKIRKTTENTIPVSHNSNNTEIYAQSQD